MRHITVELSAIDEIVGDRFLQSIEFDQGSALAALLCGQIASAKLSPKLAITAHEDGVFITAPRPVSDSRYLVIDLVQSGLFRELSDADALFVFQKLLRFAKKAWQGLALNFAERIIPNSTKAVLFPFRGFRPAPFRITIEREPWADRLNKRGDRGNYLLAYRAGHDGGDGNDTAELTTFKKAYEAVADVRRGLLQTVSLEQVPSIDQLQVSELVSSANFDGSSLYRRLEDWLPLLTAQQCRFVTAPIIGSHRIEGAAGTGKTLSLMLKAVLRLREAKESNEDFHAVFVTHSDATKRSIAEILTVIDGDNFSGATRSIAQQSLKVCTLSELCGEQLRQSISETEFIDRDAMESKELQLLYISDVFANSLKEELPAHDRFLSPVFSTFLKQEDEWKIVEMIQHEISVVIKGRASEDFDKYRKLQPLKYGLPTETDADKGFVFSLFRAYQERLGEYGQFDTDDVVLTTIGQLDTPIWRRRRAREGYHAVFIDETHLFNINELHLFHYFTRVEGPYPIIYSVDRSQAVGDRGWTTADIANSLGAGEFDGEEAKVKTIFRSSVDIVNLAFSIVSSGATLFTNFDNPLSAASSGFTDSEERLCKPPLYVAVPNEEALVEEAFGRSERMAKELGVRKSDILIVTLDQSILDRMAAFATDKNKAHVVLKKRGDALAVEAARQSAQLILAHADYVGGLEFAGVVLVGVDGGRVPPVTSDVNESSKNYLSYAAHNRLYVAVTRARYRVVMLGEQARGPSRIIQPAISAGVLQTAD